MIQDVAPRPHSSIIGVYDLDGRVVGSDHRLTPLATAFDFGRFAPHLTAGAHLLPGVVLDHTPPPEDLGLVGGATLPTPLSARILVLATPRRDALLVLHLELAPDANAEEIAGLLATTCFERDAMTLAGVPLLDWIAQRAPGVPARFGRNVHQCVTAGDDLARSLLTQHDGTGERCPADVFSIVLRGAVNPQRGDPRSISWPRGLNNPGETMVAHGRGVSLMAGWAEHLRYALAAIAMQMVSALGVVHRVRLEAFTAMALSNGARDLSTAEARGLITELSERLNELQLDLSFGVDAYVDSVLMPELVLDAYQSSLREATGLGYGLENTSRIVSRLKLVIEARLAALTAEAQARDAESQAETERRQNVFAAMVAIGSLIALPPALLLAFFGVNSIDINTTASILDFRAYWPAYLAAWLPFVALAVVGLLLRRRRRPATTPTRSPVPAPRVAMDPVPAAMDPAPAGVGAVPDRARP